MIFNTTQIGVMLLAKMFESVNRSGNIQNEEKTATFYDANLISRRIEGLNLRQSLNGPNGELIDELENRFFQYQSFILKQHIGEDALAVVEPKLPEITNEKKKTIGLTKVFFDFVKGEGDAVIAIKSVHKFVAPLLKASFPIAGVIIDYLNWNTPSTETKLIRAMRDEMHTEFEKINTAQVHLTNVLLSEMMLMDYRNHVHNPLMLLQDSFDKLLIGASRERFDLFKSDCDSSSPRRIAFYLKGLVEQCNLRSVEAARQEAAISARFRRSINEIIDKRANRSDVMTEDEKLLYEQLKFESYSAVQRVNNLTEVDEIFNSLGAAINKKFIAQPVQKTLEIMQSINTFLRARTKRHAKRSATAPQSNSCFLSYFIEEKKYKKDAVYSLLNYIRYDVAKTLLFVGACTGVSVMQHNNVTNATSFLQNYMNETHNNTLYADALSWGNMIATSVDTIQKYVSYKMSFSREIEIQVVKEIIDKFNSNNWNFEKRLLNKIYNELNGYGSDIYKKQVVVVNKETYITDMEIKCEGLWCFKVEWKGILVVVTQSLKDDYARILKAIDWYVEKRGKLHETYLGIEDVALNKIVNVMDANNASAPYRSYLILRHAHSFIVTCDGVKFRLSNIRGCGLRCEVIMYFVPNLYSMGACAVVHVVFLL